MADVPPISHSMRALFKSCPRKVFYRYVAGIEPDQDSPALVIGSAFHKGLEVWRTTTDDSQAINDALDELTPKLVAMGKEDEYIEDEQSRVTAYLSGYFKVYADDLGKDIKSEVELKSANGKLIAVLDGVFTDELGKLWIIEDKTRASFSIQKDWLLPLDEQILNYAVMLVVSGVQPSNLGGCLFRETKKAGIKRTKKECRDAYFERVLDLYSNSPECYQENVVYFDYDQVMKYRMENFYVDSQLAGMFKHTDMKACWYRNTGSCMSKYGACEFLQLCATGTDTTTMAYRANGKPPLDGGKFIKETGIIKTKPKEVSE